MVWLIGILIVIAISFYLAYRSMKDYQEKPQKKHNYGVFLIQSPSQITLDLLHQLYDFAYQQGIIISWEKLSKGKEKVLVIFAPKQIQHNFPELSLLELEDYTKQFPEHQLLSFEIGLPEKSKGLEFKSLDQVENLDLETNERLFVQVATLPTKTRGVFQSTIRVGIISEGSVRKLDLSKKFEERLHQVTNLRKQIKPQTSIQTFTHFRTRSLYPSQLQELKLDATQLLTLLKVI